MSYISLTYHIVFGTYKREYTIAEDHEKELYKFIFSFCQKRGFKVWRIGGMPDHIHILCDLPPAIAPAMFVRNLKTETSKFLRVNPHFPHWKKWAEGYGIFTIDAESRQNRINYIMNQKEHHSAGATDAHEAPPDACGCGGYE